MQNKKHFSLLFFLIYLAFNVPAQAQVLTMKEAVQTGLDNYSSIKAKANYAKASRAYVGQAAREYLPDLSVSAQQDYGTVNGQTGPLYGYRGLSVASAGPALSSQNWNAAFGALYLANINWDFFSFGRAHEKVRVAQQALDRDERDLTQERFQQEVRIAAAYLNLLVAQRITRSQQNNLERAQVLRNNVVVRVKNGLNAGVDSSLANAEVSNAAISLTRARDYEQEQANQLAQLMGVVPSDFVTDTSLIARIPSNIYNDTDGPSENHPLLQYYKSRISLSDEQARYYRTFNYPTFSAFGVYQGRGSGFDYNYGAQDPNGYSAAYGKGIDPTRVNYLVGLGLVWNLTSPLRVHQQVAAQHYISGALKEEYNLVDQRLRDQLILADQKIKNALDNYREAPVQVKAASDAYLQKSVLYKNGLSNIVDVTQALYALNRAETDRDVAYTNVWQALLLKAAAGGDFTIFINEF
jgi:outer membrane protein TolC